jgi:predicted permease
MLQDLRYAVRTLGQQKAWTAVVVVSLALGIGTNTAIFSAVSGLFLQTLPVDAPDTLVRFGTLGPSDMANNSSEYGPRLPVNGEMPRTTFPYGVVEAFRAANQTLTEVAAGAPAGALNVIVDGQAELADGYIATGNFLPLLGVDPILGRSLGPGDDDPAAPAVAVIGEAYWTERFGRDPGAVGTTVRINDVPVTIVGVLPASFTGVERMATTPREITLPLSLDPTVVVRGRPNDAGVARLGQPTTYWLQVFGRLRPGVTPAQVEGNLGGVFQATARKGMDAYLAGLSAEDRALSRNQGRADVPRLMVSSAARGLYDTPQTAARGVAMLSVVVALILLIVCANVANLLLSRAAARQHELSVRLSMGATRGRLVRQLLTESVLVALLGAAAGMLVALWGRRLLPDDLGTAALDWRVFAFTAGLAVVSGLVFGIAPALRATGRQVSAALKESGRTLSASRTLLGRGLLVTQLAISVVLLVGTGLFLRTVGNLEDVDVGFDPENLRMVRVDGSVAGYAPDASVALFDRREQRVRTVPGVRDVSQAWPALLSGGVNSTAYYQPGDGRDDSADREIYRMVVAPDFFGVMGMPLLTGRGFSAADGDGAPLVALLNEAAVRKFYDGANPVGERFGSSPEAAAEGEIEVVGVVRDARYDTLREAAEPTMYVPHAQRPAAQMWMMVRTAGDPAAVTEGVRAAVQVVEPTLPLTQVVTQTESIAQRMAEERVFAQAGLLFGGLALLVASVGLYGLMSYSVARRTGEIGIRMALGAERTTVVRMVLGESFALVAVGVVLGLFGAVGTTRLIEARLFGVTALDGVSFAGAVMVLVAVSAVAAYWPARRASRVDPIRALQYE